MPCGVSPMSVAKVASTAPVCASNLDTPVLDALPENALELPTYKLLPEASNVMFVKKEEGVLTGDMTPMFGLPVVGSNFSRVPTAVPRYCWKFPPTYKPFWVTVRANTRESGG